MADQDSRPNSVNFSEISQLSSPFWKRCLGKLIATGLIVTVICTVGYLTITMIYPTLTPPTVETKYGKVEGFRIVTIGKTVQAFRGVPYAQPPVGELRLRKPKEPTPWKGVLKADKHPAICIQGHPKELHSNWASDKQQSEDCLYMNIYVPGVAKLGRNLPVMVWIHGGGFWIGGLKFYDQSTLAAFGDVIVVAISYRLGLLGFMKSYHSDEIPGNMGLHDQQMALNWINENIDAFGGNPNDLTLFGESAGGISVGFHMISPNSRGLFTKAILQSGSPLTPVMMVGQETGPVKVAIVANKTGCPYIPKAKGDKYATFTKATYDCLRKVDLAKLIDAQQSMIASKRDLAFYPMEDNDFFPIHPYESLKNSDFGDQKSILIGNNANEGALFLSMGLPDLFPRHGELPENLTSDVIAEKMKSKFKNGPGAQFKDKFKVIMEFMFGGDDANSAKVAAKLDRYLGEAMFLCPNLMFVDSFLKRPNTTAFYYTFDPKASVHKDQFKWLKGAVHHDEVLFIFGHPVRGTSYTQKEIALSRQMMEDWTHFAKTGRPADRRKWSPCSKDTRFYLTYDLVEQFKVTEGMPPNQCDQYFETFYDDTRKNYAFYEKKKK